MTYTLYVTFNLYVNIEQIEQQQPTNGTDLMRLFVPQSPFVALLGVRIEELTDGEAVLRLPWRPELATVGDMVHGGAISALADITVMAAAWCGRDLPDRLRGVTTSLSLQFLEPAHATDLIGRGRPLRRGTTLTALEADIETPSGIRIATAMASYKVG